MLTTLIAHRGNISGKIPKWENHPKYIIDAILAGYDVEIDVWLIGNNLYLGHDTPQYPITLKWLVNYLPVLWVHCKNKEALSYFNKYDSIGFNYFSHETDEGVLTSHNYIWSTNLYDNGILVLPEVFNTTPTKNTLGICSDLIENYKEWL